MRWLIVLAFALVAVAVHAQVTIRGRVKDTKGRPVPGASIAIKDSYDGGTSDSTGHFQFHSSEKGEHTLLTTSIGFKLAEQKIMLNQSALSIDIILREESSEL